ncbi:MAG: methyltransferase domain-containing protein, partial [Candidatus Njordarchaeales archaeon]
LNTLKERAELLAKYGYKLNSSTVRFKSEEEIKQQIERRKNPDSNKPNISNSENSTKLYSFNPLLVVLGLGAISSFISVHPVIFWIIAGILGLGLGIGLFFAIWEIFEPDFIEFLTKDVTKISDREYSAIAHALFHKFALTHTYFLYLIEIHQEEKVLKLAQFEPLLAGSGGDGVIWMLAEVLSLIRLRYPDLSQRIENFIFRESRGYLEYKRAVNLMLSKQVPVVSHWLINCPYPSLFIKEIMRKLGIGEDGSLLINPLEFNRNIIRECVIISLLSSIKDPKVGKLLIEALNNPNVSIRLSAIKSLRKLADPRTAELLIKALEDGNLGVRQAAAQAYIKIAGIPEPKQENKELLEKLKVSNDIRVEENLLYIDCPEAKFLIQKLREKKMPTDYAIKNVIPKVIEKVQKDRERIRLAIDLGVRLAEKEVPPCDTLEVGFLGIIQLAKEDAERFIAGLRLLEFSAITWHKKFARIKWKSVESYHGAYRTFITNIVLPLVSLGEDVQEKDRIMGVLLDRVKLETKIAPATYRTETYTEEEPYTEYEEVLIGYSGSDCFPIYDYREVTRYRTVKRTRKILVVPPYKYEYLDYTSVTALVTNLQELKRLISEKSQSGNTYPATPPTTNQPNRAPTQEELKIIKNAFGEGLKALLEKEIDIEQITVISPSLQSPAEVRNGKLFINPNILRGPPEQLRVIFEGHELYHLLGYKEREARNLTLQYLFDHNLLQSHIEFLQNNNIGLKADRDWLSWLRQVRTYPAESPDRLTLKYDFTDATFQINGVDVQKLYDNTDYFEKGPNGEPIALIATSPFIVHWPLRDYEGGNELIENLSKIRDEIEGILGEGYASWTKPEYWHSTIFSVRKSLRPDVNKDINYPEIQRRTRETLSSVQPYEITFSRILIVDNGAIIAVGYVDNEQLTRLRDRLKQDIPKGHRTDSIHITLGRMIKNPPVGKLKDLKGFVQRHRKDNLGKIVVSFVAYANFTGPVTNPTVKEIYRQDLSGLSFDNLQSIPDRVSPLLNICDKISQNFARLEDYPEQEGLVKIKQGYEKIAQESCVCSQTDIWTTYVRIPEGKLRDTLEKLADSVISILPEGTIYHKINPENYHISVLPIQDLAAGNLKNELFDDPKNRLTAEEISRVEEVVTRIASQEMPYKVKFLGLRFGTDGGVIAVFEDEGLHTFALRGKIIERCNQVCDNKVSQARKKPLVHVTLMRIFSNIEGGALNRLKEKAKELKDLSSLGLSLKIDSLSFGHETRWMHTELDYEREYHFGNEVRTSSNKPRAANSGDSYPATLPTTNQPNRTSTPEELNKIKQAFSKGLKALAERGINLEEITLISPSLQFPAEVRGGILYVNPNTLRGPPEQLRVIFEGHELWHLLGLDEQQACQKTIEYLIQNNLLDKHIRFLNNNDIGLVVEKGWLQYLKQRDPLPSVDPIYGKVGFNPFPALDDPEIRKVFSQIIERRYDVRVLSEYYHLGKVPPHLTWKGEELSVSKFVQRMVEFIRLRKNRDPHEVAREFRKEFPSMARPHELDEIFDRYMEIKLRVFDLEVIKDVLKVGDIIADIGAGKHKLADEILSYSDEVGLNIREVTGTDINEWQDKTGRIDPRKTFFMQDSTTRLPFAAYTYDVVILKWVLHHMSYREQKKLLENISEKLRPGGRIIIFEALMISNNQRKMIKREFLREIKNPNTWPPGTYFAANQKLTEDFMELSTEKQRKVNALEDFFGHNLIMGRDWMPQLFTYRTVQGFQQILARLGLRENRGLRRVYGSMPIMRMGPPSIRLVFELPLGTKYVMIPYSDRGEDKTMELSKGMNDEEKEHVRNILEVLESRDVIEGKFNDIVVLGNERLDTFTEALRLVDEGIGERIVIIGEYGFATIPLIEEALKWGYKVRISQDTVIDNLMNWKYIKLGITNDNKREIIRVSEANIIQQIMLQILEVNKGFKNIKRRIEEEGIEKIFLLVDGSESTQKLLIGYRRKLDSEKAFKKSSGHKIIFFHSPHQQLRSRAVFGQIFSAELIQQTIQIVSHNVSYQNIPKERIAIFEDLLRESWRLVLYSDDYGKGYINLRSEKYPQGIDSIPQAFWKSLTFLFRALPIWDKLRIANELISLMKGEFLGVKELMPENNSSLKEFIETISSEYEAFKTQNTNPTEKRNGSISPYPAHLSTIDQPDRIPTPKELKIIKTAFGDQGLKALAEKGINIEEIVVISPSLPAPAEVRDGQLFVNPNTLRGPPEQLKIIFEGHELFHLLNPSSSEQQARQYTIQYLLDNDLLGSHIKFLKHNDIGFKSDVDWSKSLVIERLKHLRSDFSQRKFG